MNKAESKAMTIAKKVASFLKKEYGATRVMLFGSLAKGFFEKDSDIDIYFEGIPNKRILDASGHCFEVFRQHDIDLIPDAFCHDQLRRKILKEGIVL
jgi:predicted nucleotidyltransferase